MYSLIPNNRIPPVRSSAMVQKRFQMVFEVSRFPDEFSFLSRSWQ